MAGRSAAAGRPCRSAAPRRRPRSIPAGSAPLAHHRPGASIDHGGRSVWPIAAIPYCPSFRGCADRLLEDVRGAHGTGVEMPIVTVLQGQRPLAAKRALIEKITDAFVDTLGLPAESVQVWIQETPPESWGVAGRLT